MQSIIAEKKNLNGCTEEREKKTKKLKIVVVKRTSSMEYWKVAKTHF